MTGCVCRELPSPSFVVVTTQLFVTSNATLKYESLIRKRLVESEGANFLKSKKFNISFLLTGDISFLFNHFVNAMNLSISLQFLFLPSYHILLERLQRHLWAVVRSHETRRPRE